MKSIVAGVYESHDNAVNAVKELQNAGFNSKRVSLLGKADIVNNHIHVKSNHTAEEAELSIGLAAGAVLGILTGVGIFAIPGLGFLYGAGALTGVIAGLDFGVMGGGIVAIFTSMGMDRLVANRYEKHLNDGKYVVFVQGSDDDLKKAQQILHTSGLHMELDRH